MFQLQNGITVCAFEILIDVTLPFATIAAILLISDNCFNRQNGLWLPSLAGGTAVAHRKAAGIPSVMYTGSTRNSLH